MATFGTILTKTGERLIAEALLGGEKLEIAALAVGDGGGEAYQPTAEMTALRRECWRGPVNAVSLDEDSPNVIVVDGLVPAEVGGFTIREAGVFDAAGNLIGVMNTPQTEKVVSNGSTMTEQYIQLYLAVSSAAAVELSADPSAVMASREDLDKLRGELEARAAELRAEGGEALDAHNRDAQSHPDLREAVGAGSAAAVAAHDADTQAHPALRQASDDAQTTADQAQAAADAAQSTADAAQTAAATANTTADNAMPKTGGTFTGNVVAANPAVGTQAVRNIYAGTGDLTAGSSSLTTGVIYFVYE